jgi:hypothetical protein
MLYESEIGEPGDRIFEVSDGYSGIYALMWWNVQLIMGMVVEVDRIWQIIKRTLL